MKTFGFVNQKGGCGKTTTAVNLAGALSVKGNRVLLVDLDPQAHATMALGHAVDDEPCLAHVLMRGTPVKRALVSGRGSVDLLPASLELAEFEEVSARMLSPERVLKSALKAVADEYDYAILDCPPRADGVLTANAVRAADLVVLVVEMSAFALQGAVRAAEIFEQMAADMDDTFELRVVGTLYDRRTRLARELLIGTQARFGHSMFDTVIHNSVRLRESAASGVPVQVLDPASRAALDFEAFADEILTLYPPKSRTLRPTPPVSSLQPAPRTGAAPGEIVPAKATPRRSSSDWTKPVVPAAVGRTFGAARRVTHSSRR